MTEVTSKNFGYLIAYLLPGFATLVLISEHSPLLRGWLAGTTASSPTIGGFFYVTLASLALGIFLNALRVFSLDRLFHATGLPHPNWEFSELRENLEAFQAVVENNFRYYQFFGNMALVTLLALLNPTQVSFLLPANPMLTIAVLVLIFALLILASRDALRNYYTRSEKVLTPHNKSRV